MHIASLPKSSQFSDRKWFRGGNLTKSRRTLTVAPVAVLQMPSIVRVHIHGARNLPVMDRASKLADAYVELIFSKQAPRKTEVIRKTLNPVFNATFKLEVPNDEDLVTEPLVFTVMDRCVPPAPLPHYLH